MKTCLIAVLCAIILPCDCRADREGLELEIPETESGFFYVGVGWRLVHRYGGEVSRSGVRIGCHLVLEKYWPLQEEKTVQSAGPWHSEIMKKFAEDLTECGRALEEGKEFKNNGHDPQLEMVGGKKLTITAGDPEHPDLRAQIPASLAVAYAKEIQEILAIEEAANNALKQASAKGADTRPAKSEIIPKYNSKAFQIKPIEAYSHSDSKRKFIFGIEGSIGTSGLSLAGGLMLENLSKEGGKEWTGFGGNEDLRKFVGELKKCEAALFAGKKFESIVGKCRLKLEKSNLLIFESGRTSQAPFIEVTIPAAEAGVFAQKIQEALTLADAINSAISNPAKR